MKTARGFSLVELLVVAAVLSVLTALLFPSLELALDETRVSACMNNQRQIVFAVTEYCGDFREFPMSYMGNTYADLDRIITSAQKPYYPGLALFETYPVYANQGALWAFGYLPDEQVLIDPGFRNEREDNAIGLSRWIHAKGRDYTEYFTPKTAHPKVIWTAPTNLARSTYVMYDQDPSRGTNPYWFCRYKPRSLARPIKETTAVTMCFMSAGVDPRHGGHNKERLVSAYADGHARAFGDAYRTWLSAAIAVGHSYTPAVQSNAYVMGNGWPYGQWTYWGFAANADR